MNNTIFPCLWYDGDAKQSAEFYCEIFGGTITADTPVVLNIEVFGQKLMLLNGGPQFQKNATISFMVLCETEEEVEKYWKPLSENGIVYGINSKVDLDIYNGNLWSLKMMTID